MDVGYAMVTFKHGRGEDYARIDKLYIGRGFRKLGKDINVIRNFVMYLFANYSVLKVYYKFKQRWESQRRKLISLGFMLDKSTIKTRKENFIVFKDWFIRKNFGYPRRDR